MNDKLSINQDVFNHFLIEKLIELKTENTVTKYLLNAMLLEANPHKKTLLDAHKEIPNDILNIIKYQATESIVNDLRIVSNDFDALIQSFLNRQ